MLLAEQLVHQRCVHPGPLVLRTAPLKFPTPTTDRDRTVSRRGNSIEYIGALNKNKVSAEAHLFNLASQNSIPFTIHAGEAMGPESIYQALDLGARRIGRHPLH